MHSSNLIEKFEIAFHGVVLGQGMSLREAQSGDTYGREPVDKTDWIANSVNDWTQIPFRELERNCVAHLDPEGYRYYIPALCISVIKHYDSSSMRVIGTLASLYPKKENWEYYMNRYNFLSKQQKECLAEFVRDLPKMLSLDPDDQVCLKRAVRNYWHTYL